MTMNLIEPAIPEQKVTSVWQRSSRFIVCLFCGLRGRQVRDSLLCSNCLIDPTQTRIAVHVQLDGWLTQQTKALETWETIRDTHAARWAQIEASRDRSDYAARCERHRAAHNVYGLLLDAQAAYEAALQPLAAERERLETALAILERL